MKKFKLTYKQFGESAVLIEWPKIISKDILNDVHLFTLEIKKNNIKEILEVSYVYNSLIVIYDFNVTNSKLIEK